MPTINVFTTKENELIALGASVAAGCQPCTEHHVRTARTAGACDRSVALMIETAIEVRNNATRAMETWARRCQGAKPEVDAEFRAQKRLITELASVTAAVCVNSVAELTIHLAAAQALGASEEQIRSAIAIAHRIKKVAEEKLAAVENEAGAPSSRCCEPKPETSGTVEEQGAGCGCGQAPR